MQIVTEYCDRCKKEINNDPLKHKLFPIICKKPKAYIRFTTVSEGMYCETRREVCQDCLKDFKKWWDGGEACTKKTL